MSYGDLNYLLGSNKAIFYFNRRIKGKQIFNNSMYPLEQQRKYKDLLVIDDIVFTSSCKWNSVNQNQKNVSILQSNLVGLVSHAQLD